MAKSRHVWTCVRRGQACSNSSPEYSSSQQRAALHVWQYLPRRCGKSVEAGCVQDRLHWCTCSLFWSVRDCPAQDQMKITYYFPTKQFQVKCFAVTRWGSTTTSDCMGWSLEKGKKGRGRPFAHSYLDIAVLWVDRIIHKTCLLMLNLATPH